MRSCTNVGGRRRLLGQKSRVWKFLQLLRRLRRSAPLEGGHCLRRLYVREDLKRIRVLEPSDDVGSNCVRGGGNLKRPHRGQFLLLGRKLGPFRVGRLP